jgi:hypothetical protein
MQHSRRHNPYPLTWETPIAVACTVLLALVVGVHVGRGLANLTAGAGWCWPATAQLFTSAPAVFAGDAAAGLHTTGPLAGSASLVAWLVVTELAVIVILATAAVAVLRRWGPTRLKGMASADEAERLLGLSRLRRVRQVIRPDLHPTRKALTMKGRA